jgi:pilus assembly protein Flp/PilA
MAPISQLRDIAQADVASSSPALDGPIEVASQMFSIFRRLVRSERGALAMEYALVASLISAAAVAAMMLVGLTEHRGCRPVRTLYCARHNPIEQSAQFRDGHTGVGPAAGPSAHSERAAYAAAFAPWSHLAPKSSF